MKRNRHQPSALQLEKLTHLFQQGMMTEAEQRAKALTSSFPSHGYAWKVLGVIYLEDKNYTDGLHAAVRAVELQPKDAAVYNNLGSILFRLERFDEAELNLRKALTIAPDYPKALLNLGSLLIFRHKLQESEDCCRRALSIDPLYTNAHVALGNALELQNRLPEAQASYRAALAISPDMAALHTDLLQWLCLDVQIEPGQLFAEHLAFGEHFEAPFLGNYPHHTNTKNPGRQLQIGLVTGDLNNHALANFLEPLFSHLLRKPALTLHVYYTSKVEDAITQRFKACLVNWNAVASLNDAELALKIAADGIDILIDLAGHTALNRLLTFARKPAPVQASWLGYLGTTGLQAMDYYVCDPYWITPGELDWQFLEKPAYLPAAVVFQPNPAAPAINELPALTSDSITFGSFNRHNKINDAVIVLWSMLMRSVAHSKMVLGAIPPEFQDGMIQRFEQEGIARGRLTFFPRATQTDYLALHHQVDFCLDTFPHGGGATTAHAAWMGVPTLCLAGETPASRFGATEMHHLGLDEFIADSIDDFVNRGKYWAVHVTELSALRQGMRLRFEESALGQYATFAGNFEAMLRAMWRRWCDDLPPAPIVIDNVENGSNTASVPAGLEPTANELARLSSLHGSQRYQEAEPLARRLISEYPEHGFAWKILGSVLHALGRLEESLALQKQIVALRPHDHEAHFNLACELHQQGQLDDSVRSYISALGLQPNNANAFNNLGNIFKTMGLAPQAEQYCRQALALQPDMANAHNNLGNALHAQGRLVEAQASYRRALTLKPDWPDAYNNLAITLKDQGLWLDAKDSFRRALQLKPEWAAAHSNLLYCLSHDVQTDPLELHAQHMAFGKDFETPLMAGWPLHANTKDPARPLHIGFVSADFYDHALTNFLEPVFDRLAQSKSLVLHAYYTHIYEDQVTQRMRAHFAHWNKVASLNDVDFADQIRQDGIDILIDLTGHTAHNRLLAFARKPAPVQASWLGYLGTTGLQAMDYYLCDTFWVPPGELDWQFSEKMAYLPSAVLFQPSGLSPPVESLPALGNGYVTLGSFNRPNKLNESVIVLWSMLLKRLPNARMLLGGIPPDSEQTLRHYFANEGISQDRLDFYPRSNLTDYLALHNQVDLCLDTFPYGGGATTAHAAWMGVPTLSLAGESPPSRFGSAITHQLELDEFIATNIDDFIEKGSQWADNLSGLATIRQGLRERFRASALGQPGQLADHLEATLRMMWQRWCDGLPPAALEVKSGSYPHIATDIPTPLEPTEATLEKLIDLYNSQQYAEATEVAQGLIKTFPANALAWKIIGSIYQAQERYAEALPATRRAIELSPNDATNHNNMGVALMTLERLDEAESNFRQAIAIDPDYGKALVNLGAILQRQGQLMESEACCSRAIAVDPSNASAYIGLGNSLEAQGRLSEAQASYYRADMAHEPRRAVAHSNVLYLLNHDVLVDPQHLFAEHVAFGEQFETSLRAQWAAHTNAKDPLRRLKVGFVSGDLNHHALANFLLPVFTHLSMNPSLELHAYYTQTLEDAVTQRMRPCFAKWHPIAHLDDADLDTKIRKDNIDILIDLSGHTMTNRLLTFARKPAPVQISWLGYLGTTGLQAMDYYLCDPYWIPPGELDWQFVEKLAYLPAAVAFEPSGLTAAVNPLPALANGHITFGSFNRLNKINEAVIALWSMLLRSVPSAKMVLGAIPIEQQNGLIQTFGQLGIDASRLTFFPRTNDAAYQALHHQVDLCLDTFPHGGGATTAHALWMGVPTLCLLGETPASRFSATLMHHAGLDEFIGRSIEEFVQKGRAWADNLYGLATIRAGMRSKLDASALGQHANYATHFGNKLRDLWRNWCAGLPAADEQTMEISQSHKASETGHPKENARDDLTIQIVSATKLSEEDFWARSALGISLKRLTHQGTVMAVNVAFENSTGLPIVFNRAIESASADAVMVFIHDDVWIDEFDFANAVQDALEHFDVIGVAGNRRRLPNQPAWPFVDLQFSWDQKSNLSGVVAHGEGPFGEPSVFGPAPAECELLDGVFLAVRKSQLETMHVRFDDKFDFHFYDMDFCRSARQAGLRLGTWPLSLTHQSGGAFGSPRWQENYHRYLMKWEMTTVNIDTTSPSQETTDAAQDLQKAVNDALMMASDCEKEGQFEQAKFLYLEIQKVQPENLKISISLKLIETKLKNSNAIYPSSDKADLKNKAKSSVKIFCIAHKAPELPLPDDIPIIWLGAAPVSTKGQNVVYRAAEISEEFDAWHTFLGGSSGTFSINKLLRDKLIEWSAEDRISIIQYRKFLAGDTIGTLADNYPGLYLVKPSELNQLDLPAIHAEVATPYLLPQPVKIGNLYQQYASCHRISDLLRYTALAVDLEIISWSESSDFFNSSHLIPGGIEFGIYPIKVFMGIIENLQRVSMAFLKTHQPTSMNAYQRRAVSFCNERLGSYLLQKELNKEYNNQIPNELFGYMHTVSDGNIYVGGAQ